MLPYTDARYGPPLRATYNKLCTMCHRLVLRILVQATGKLRSLLRRRPPADLVQEYRSKRAHEKVYPWSMALLRMGDYRLLMSFMSGELEKAGKRGPRG